MQPRQLIGTALVPGGEELRLFRRGADFIIAVGRNELMSSRMSGSEVALATLTCTRLHGHAGQHMLIGGYGMGFTLRAALDRLDATARVTVAELVPDIIAWAKGPMSELAAGCLDDPRVTVFGGDVSDCIRDVERAYDAILLDVDNGPDGLTRSANSWLYSFRGLAAAKAALKPKGILAIWSAYPDAAFTQRLTDSGFKVEKVNVRARANGKGARHVIWLATKV